MNSPLNPVFKMIIMTNDTDPVGRDSLYGIPFALILILLVLGAFFPTLWNGFVWDDFPIICENEMLTNIGNYPKLFLLEDTYLNTDVRTGCYRPFTYISFLFDNVIWDGKAVGFHLTNLLLHMSAVVLLFYLIKVMFGQWKLAFIASLVFALHPVQVEAVNFISGGRNVLLCAVSVFGSMLLHLKGRRIVSAIVFIPGVLSKEYALMMPAALLGYMIISSAPPMRLKAKLRELAPYLFIIAAYLVTRALVLGAMIGFVVGDVMTSILRVPFVILSYIWLVLVPTGLSSNPLLAEGTPFWPVLICIPAFITICALAVRARKSIPPLNGFLWSVLFLLPVSGLAPLGEIEMADRYAYLSMAGISLVLSWFMVRFLHQKALIALLLGLTCIFFFKDLTRTLTWRDNHSLYTRMIEDTPESSFGYYNLGMEHYRLGELDEAEALLSKTLQMVPTQEGYVELPERHQAYIVLASIYSVQGEPENALKTLNEALDVAPGDIRVRAYISSLLHKEGRIREAEAAIKEAGMNPAQLRHSLNKMAAHLYERGIKLQEAGNKKAALSFFLLSLEYRADSAEANFHAGYIHAENGDIKASVEYFEKAVGLSPGTREAHYNLSLAYMLTGRRTEAKQAMLEYLSLGGRPTMESIDVLGNSRIDQRP